MSNDGYNASQSGANPEADPMIGQVIDKRYKVTHKLGEGGMGEVYAADHLRINRSLALKLLRAEVLTNEEAVLRFEQEAMTASSIGHENIIRIEDSGKLDDGRIYLAMELLEGMPFNDLLEEHDIGPQRLVNILIQTCHGLRAAHDKNIIHRDMKPENIYITTKVDGSDLPKLLDFGIAKVSQAEGENHLTRTGTIFGTPFYMAPEQALGQAVDCRVDIYAMGVIMYEVFAGEVPFGGESFMGILTQHITSEPVPPSVTAQKNGRILPPGVEDVILKAMKKEPNERYQNMGELIEALVPLYRTVAGSGMSTYMAAHHPATGSMPPLSGGYAQPITQDESSQPYAPANMAPAPMPMGPPGTQPPGGYAPGTQPPNAHPPGTQPPGGYAPGTHPPNAHPPNAHPPNAHPPGTHPPNGHPPGGYAPGTQPPGTQPPGTHPPGTHPPGGYAPGTHPPNPAYNPGAAPSDSLMMPATKSRKGIFFMIALVLLGAGGGAAWFLTRPSDDEVAKNEKPETTDNTDPNGTNVVTTPLDAGSEVATATIDAGAITTALSDASTTTQTDIADAATTVAVAVPDAKVSDKPPIVETTSVLVDSIPAKAKIYRDGKKIGRAPMNIDVKSGETVSLIFKHSKHKDLQFTVDAAKDKVTAKLERKKRPSGNTDPVRIDPVKPKVKFCDQPKNFSKPRCMLE